MSGLPLSNNPRLQRLDDTHRGLHSHIKADDECYFFFEYTSGKGFSFGATNGFITNLKKSPLKRANYEYRYKGEAIAEAARLLSGALNPDWLRAAVLVPVPPSKRRGHAEYDDRMGAICRAVNCSGQRATVREIVVQNASTEAAHVSSVRPSVQDLIDIYEIDEDQCTPEPTAIGIVDDVLTAGVHYRAMHTVLSRRFPGVPITGLFLARRIFPEDQADLSHLFSDL
jgi:hypothetical protein